MKKCSFCAEDIQDAAIKCRYCGSMLSGPGPSSLAPAVPSVSSPSRPIPTPSSDATAAPSPLGPSPAYSGTGTEHPSRGDPTLLYLDQADDHIYVECRVCRRRMKIPRTNCGTVSGGFTLTPPVECICGSASAGIARRSVKSQTGPASPALQAQPSADALGLAATPTAALTLWSLLIEGKTYGPYTAEALKQMIAAGQIAPTTLAWHSGSAGWVSVQTYVGLGATNPGVVPPSSPPKLQQVHPPLSLMAKEGEERVMAAAGVVGVGAFVVLKLSGLPFFAAVVAGGLVFGVVFRVAQEWREGRALLREGVAANRAVAIVKVVVPPIGFPLLALFFFFILTSPVSWNVLSRMPSSGSGGASEAASVQKPSEETVAAEFLEVWKARGLASASALVDPRTPEGAGIVEIYEGLKSYENLRAVGDDSILLRQTGNTIQVRVVAIDAVVKVRGGFGFDAIRLEILVAKDSGRICLVQPLGSR